MNRKLAVAICGLVVTGFSAADRATAQQDSAVINLTCTGTVSYEETVVFMPTGKRIERTGSATVVIGDGNDRIKLPREIYSKHNEGRDGWFPLIEVSRTASEIKARARLNSMNKPKLTLDRIAGTISFVGTLGDFTGTCRKFENDGSAQQF